MCLGKGVELLENMTLGCICVANLGARLEAFSLQAQAKKKALAKSIDVLQL